MAERERQGGRGGGGRKREMCRERLKKIEWRTLETTAFLMERARSCRWVGRLSIMLSTLGSISFSLLFSSSFASFLPLHRPPFCTHTCPPCWGTFCSNRPASVGRTLQEAGIETMKEHKGGNPSTALMVQEAGTRNHARTPGAASLLQKDTSSGAGCRT